ncbi:unnamed protein product, partial [Mesorhabditis belari]|uniref:Major facilitator superfamily (MFS) profile domain-containing protein n=1 Tax=Mesorhabditis belari TaxID=2138241 RepID=A0AAF3F363_9BILA
MLNSAGNYLFTSFGGLYRSCRDEKTNLDAVKDVCVMVQSCPPNSSDILFHSLYEDRDFVCPNSGLPQHLQSLQAIGSGIGALLGGHAADQFGRKLITNTGAILMCIAGLLGAISPNWTLLAVAMFGMGFSYGVLVDSSMTLASESVGPKYRIVQTLAFQWALAMQIAAFIAYVTGTWRMYLIVINVAVIPALFLVPLWVESPRWLIQKRKYSKAAESLNVMSKWNGDSVTFSEDDLKDIQLDKGNLKIYSIWHLFMTRKLFLYSMVMILSALTVETTVAVIIFDVQTLAGNPFLNIALYGTLRLWVPLFIIFLEKYSSKIGRRSLFCTSQGISNSSIFFTVYKQYSMELYPTLMRAMAVGAFGVIERIGGAMAPQLVHLSRTMWPGFGVLVASVLALASLLAGWAILPETKNATMPDTVSQEEKGIREESL